MTVKRMGALLLAAALSAALTSCESRQRTQAAVLEERYPPRSLLSPSSPR